MFIRKLANNQNTELLQLHGVRNRVTDRRLITLQSYTIVVRSAVYNNIHNMISDHPSPPPNTIDNKLTFT